MRCTLFERKCRKHIERICLKQKTKNKSARVPEVFFVYLMRCTFLGTFHKRRTNPITLSNSGIPRNPPSTWYYISLIWDSLCFFLHQLHYYSNKGLSWTISVHNTSPMSTHPEARVEKSECHSSMGAFISWFAFVCPRGCIARVYLLLLACLWYSHRSFYTVAKSLHGRARF